jgi:hypothetical protein
LLLPVAGYFGNLRKCFYIVKRSLHMLAYSSD